MSKQQLAAILEMSAQNPIPANATPAVMRAWVEDFAGRLPVAENVRIERVSCGPCDGDLLLPAGGDASRLIIFYHGNDQAYPRSTAMADNVQIVLNAFEALLQQTRLPAAERFWSPNYIQHSAPVAPGPG